jgi:hypothetical protein
MPERGPKPDDRHPRARGAAPGEDVLVEAARQLTTLTGEPVVGGVAVILHGGGRSTYDIDIYSVDFGATHERLIGAGVPWDARRREYTFDGIPVHLVPVESLGGPPKRLSTIRGVRVISLADLVRAKLTVGLEAVHRSKDLAHVVDLIERVPLRKDFAAKLPTHLRAPFKELVDQVHGPRRTTIPPRDFLEKYA